MFDMEKDERIRGLDETTMAVSMAFAHDFILEVMLTREMVDADAAEADLLSRVLVERWQRRYGNALAADAEHSPEKKRQLYATKAFVDRLARKALRRSRDVREERAAATSSTPSEVGISPAMRRAGAEVLGNSQGRAPEDLAAEVYKAMVEKA